MEKRFTAVSIGVPAELKAELKRISADEGVSCSEVARRALRYYLSVRQFRRLREELVPYAEAQGIYTDEDVFRICS